MKKLSFLVYLFFLFTSCITKKPQIDIPQDINDVIYETFPEIFREFRGVWVSTVWNLDWPSAQNLSKEEQINQIIVILDKLKELNFNNVILQVRGSGDVFYKSQYEPWSYFLTGTQGQYPGYDPLEVWVKEAHKRGILIHAWINPFRVFLKSNSVLINQKFVVNVDDNTFWINPGDEEGRKYIFNIISEILANYDIDGIHFDDYFYPYESTMKGKEFQDDSSYNNYLSTGGRLSLRDWRRQNINLFVKDIGNLIKFIRPDAIFGISPFGIWKNGIPAGITGTSSYDSTFADSKKWLELGYVDYLAPQLYWPIHQLPQSFPLLLSWWNKQNIQKRNLYPGINISSNYIDEANKIKEFNSQIFVSRATLGAKTGNIFFRMKNILSNTGNVSANWKNTLFSKPAIVPLSPWIPMLDMDSPVNIKSTKPEDNINISWDYEKSKNIFKQVIYIFYEKTLWQYEILEKEDRNFNLTVNPDNNPVMFIILPVDKIGNIKKIDIVNIL